MATYPHGDRPKRPFPYCNEVMTGFEYSTAVHMLYEGMEKEGLECFEAIRSRYDGRKRNPYDEAECGHQYARTLAAWGGLLAWSGFNFSAVDRIFTVGRSGTFFWSTGRAWGTYTLSDTPTGFGLELHVMHGELAVGKVQRSAKTYPLKAVSRMTAGDRVNWELSCP